MARVGYSPKNGRIKSDVKGVVVDRAFIAHFQVAAADAVAASANGVMAATNLTAAIQTKTTGITDPAVPRALSVVGNVAGITGNVVVTGKNYAGETITETLALNGTTTVNGNKAFKKITSIALPVQTHTPAAQVETATVVGTITTAGNATVTVTATGMTGSPKAVSVAVAEGDDASAIAGKIRAALEADEDVTALFAVSGVTDKVILTRLVPAANDATLNIAVADDTSVGINEDAVSDNTTAGVPYDIVSAGWNDILGLLYKLSHNTVLAAYLNNVKEGTEPTVVTSAAAIESNTVDLDSALDGHQVDIYLIV